MSDYAKQIIVIRKDLNMRKGKIASQAAHASMAAILNQMTIEANGEDSVRTLHLEAGTAIQQWLDGAFTKVCVYVNSEQKIVDLVDQAKAAGLPTALIVDNGKTEFNGIKTTTCCAIGPAYASELLPITGSLPLL